MTPQTNQSLAPLTYGSRPESAELHATLRSIAAQVHLVDNAHTVDRCQVRALAQSIRRVRSRVQDHFGDEIGHWLDNLQAQVDRIVARTPVNC